jgi:hypothetical protein
MAATDWVLGGATLVLAGFTAWMAKSTKDLADGTGAALKEANGRQIAPSYTPRRRRNRLSPLKSRLPGG